MVATFPEAAVPARSPRLCQLADFRGRCEQLTGRDLTDPVALHEFSVAEPEAFWRTLLDWTGLPWSGSADTVLVGGDVQTARFFPDLRLNYAEALLRPIEGADDDAPALTGVHADRPSETYSRRELRAAVERGATALAGLGLAAGDRAVAIAPNTTGVAVAALAVAALGGTLSTATPDMGTTTLLGRFEQVEPIVLILDRTTMADSAAAAPALVAGLPTLRHVVLLDEGPLPDLGALPVHRWTELAAATHGAPPAGWPRLSFDHPLVVMFSSGTTGPPKAMVHGAGGTLLEHVKEHRLHGDLRAGETLYFHTTTAWMMWNWQLSALAVGAHIVVYDGPITGPHTLWELAADHGVHVLGTSPPYLQMCQDEGYRPAGAVDLSALRAVLSTGAVLHEWQFDWVAEAVGPQPLQSISGGTDILGCFLLGHPELPVRRGRSQARSLGLDVAAVDATGAQVVGAIGELVCRRPFPSRPVRFLRDPDGARFHDAYFADHPGVWTHGDLIDLDADGSARVHGRSDGVLNVNGIRIGPAEVYTALRDVPAVADAMAVEQRNPAQPGASRMVLLVILGDGAVLDDTLERDIRRTLRRRASAAHVPSLVVAVPELPLTHNGKRSERAARDAVNGDEVANLSALKNPGSLDAIRTATLAAQGSGSHPTTPQPVVAVARVVESDARVTLGRLWRETLGLSRSEPDDHFFDLGGTSRQVMTLLRRIHEEVGADVPLTAFMDRPTLGALTRTVTPGRSPGSTGPVHVLKAGDGLPVYLLSDASGQLDSYDGLVQHLPGRRTVHGLQLPPTDDDGRPHTIAELTEQAVEVLSAIQPTGSYRLAGHASGGLVAYETACRLQAGGRSVSYLGLIDVVPPAPLLTAVEIVGRRWAGRLGALTDPRRADVLLQRFADRYAPATLAPDRRAYLAARAVHDHHRLSRYDGQATYYAAQQSMPVVGNSAAAWRRVAPELAVTEIPGRHLQLLDQEFVAALATEMASDLA